MKLITISKIGYNSPSQANWSYGIWKVDCIDTTQSYNMSYTVYETFGGDSRLKNILADSKINLIEVKGVFPQQKVVGMKHIQNMESDNFIKDLKDWYNNK